MPAVTTHPSRRRRLLSWTGGVAAVALMLLAGGWAVRTMLAPAPDVLEAPGYTLVTAVQGTVERSLQLNVSAQWSPESTIANQAAGTVTSVELDAGQEAEPGDVLYTVDLRPVVAAVGEVPAFRDLARGAEGADVAQLQRLLTSLGYYSGRADGRFGGGLYWAVRAWQRDLGLEQDGTVRQGDVVLVPELPARLALDTELEVGAALAGGEELVQLLPSAPRFTITLPEGQTRMVEPGMAVEIPRDDGGAWQAEIAEVRRGEEAGTVAVLTSVGDDPVCGDACAQVPLQEETLLPSVIHVVPEQSGVTVPTAAVVTTADGQTAAVHESGELLPVSVVASASGTAVVEGVDAGQRVRVPGDIPAGEERDSR